MSRDASYPIHFVTVVWGQEYLENFFRVSLPSMLSAGNLPAAAERHAAQYTLYTTPEDEEIVRSSNAYRTLSRILRVEFRPLPRIDGAYKHRVAAECQRQAVARAMAAGAVLAVLPPDTVWSDGTFSRLLPRLQGDGSAVLLAGIRLASESVVPALSAACPTDAGGAMTIPGRSLVALALDHFHPLSQGIFWDSPHSHSWPSHLYWRVGREGFLARCFHLHPFLVDCAATGRLPEGGTLDGDFVQGFAEMGQTPQVVTDSDEGMVCELSPSSFEIGEVWRAHGLRQRDVANWARLLANGQHRRFVRERIRFHTQDPSPAWERVERDSDRIVCRIEWWLRLISILRCTDEPLKRFRRWLRPWRVRWGLR